MAFFGYLRIGWSHQTKIRRDTEEEGHVLLCPVPAPYESQRGRHTLFWDMPRVQNECNRGSWETQFQNVQPYILTSSGKEKAPQIAATSILDIFCARSSFAPKHNAADCINVRCDQVWSGIFQFVLESHTILQFFVAKRNSLRVVVSAQHAVASGAKRSLNFIRITHYAADAYAGGSIQLFSEQRIPDAMFRCDIGIHRQDRTCGRGQNIRKWKS